MSSAHREHPRRRPRGHEPRHPPPGRPLRPRQRPLARRGPRSPATGRAGARSCSWPTSPRSRSARSSRTLRRPSGGDDSTSDARKIGDLYASFMDEERDRGARPRADPAAARRGRRRCATSATWRRSSASSSGSAAAACSASYVDTDDRDSDRYLVNIAPGRPRAARRVLLPRRQVRRDPREVRRLPRRACSASPSTTTRAGAAATVLRARDPAGRGPLGARRDPRRHQDLQPDDRSPSCRRAVPGLRLGRLRHATSAAADGHDRRGRASGSRRTSSTSRPCSARRRSRTGGPG